MSTNENSSIPPGWVGGFEQSNSAFSYPKPDLSSLPLLDNLENIDLLQRQWPIRWPEFSWETEKGSEDPKRCFQMFSPEVSRIGYTDEGRIYSIICPQLGACSTSLGCLNIEVTVTGQRGWVDETTRKVAADLTVVGKIWFSPSAMENGLVKLLWHKFKKSKLPFPSSKEHAIIVYTHNYEHPESNIIAGRSGEITSFKSPDFAKHPEAWTTGNLEVEIGKIHTTGNSEVDEFNSLVMDIFNIASGNMLQPGNILSWNVWFEAPILVKKEEWRKHAEKWRKSIDADHGSPTGPGTKPRYFDKTYFHPVEAMIEHELDLILEFLEKHL